MTTEGTSQQDDMFDPLAEVMFEAAQRGSFVIEIYVGGTVPSPCSNIASVLGHDPVRAEALLAAVIELEDLDGYGRFTVTRGDVVTPEPGSKGKVYATSQRVFISAL